MAASLILIATTGHDEGERIAHAMTPLSSYAFVFAQSLDAAVQVASTLQPELVIAGLVGLDGVTLCERLRLLQETRACRLLLLMDRAHLNEARSAGANTVLIQPTAAMLVALEAKNTLERVERRTPWVANRRTVFRGGRRLTDIGVG